MPAFEFAEIVFDRQLAAPKYHIIDLVFCQIAEGGCKAVLAGEEVLVNAEHSRTIGTLQFRRLAAEKILKVTLHGGVPDAFSFSSRLRLMQSQCSWKMYRRNGSDAR